MTDDELRAAVERVRRVNAGEPPEVVYCERWDWAGMLESDRIDLADAYLAEHDPTPLSLAVLTAELGEPNPNTLGLLYWSWTVARREVTLRKDGLCCFVGLDFRTLGQLRRQIGIVRELEEAPAACECGSGKPFSACCKTRITQ